ncbi:BA14K family protein [Stappia sp. MMSF_3263]|uniref:BA14K family protein n=1 Tax=Stappia sp. MMSF_3263 TaxID=3046693 RepID=UPI00273E386B|nr:BA14K family protein [Stappia sp. MMSF_3263]
MVFKHLAFHVFAAVLAGAMVLPAASLASPAGGSYGSSVATGLPAGVVLAQTVPGREDHADPDYLYPHEMPGGGIRKNSRNYRDGWSYRDRRGYRNDRRYRDRRDYRDRRYRPAPPPVVNRGGLRPWTPAWYAYCSSRYRSFNPRTGTYTTYSGQQRLCR